MKHWSVIQQNVRRILLEHGADVEQDRDYFIATWRYDDFTRGAGSREAIRAVVSPGVDGPVVEEIDISTVIAMSETTFHAWAKAVAAAEAAMVQIGRLRGADGG